MAVKKRLLMETLEDRNLLASDGITTPADPHVCTKAPNNPNCAVIGDSDNLASITLHERAGFEHVGTLRNVGFKHGRWLDTVTMQRALGEGAETPPDESWYPGDVSAGRTGS